MTSSSQDGHHGPERSGVGLFRDPEKGHVGGKCEEGVVTGPSQTKEDSRYVCFNGVWEGPVRVGKTDYA
jgi:hypothetical protein